MSTPQFLALNTQSGTQPQLKLYQGGLVTDIGVPFGTLETALSENALCQRVVRFLGNLYAFVGSAVYASYNYGSSWIVSVSPPSISSTASLKNICVTYINGVPCLGIIYRSTDSTSTVRLSRTFDGITWTHSPSYRTIANIGATGYLQSDLIFKSTFFAATEDAVVSVEFGSLTVGVTQDLTTIAFNQGEISVVAYNNNLYANVPVAGTVVGIFRIEGSSAIQATSFTLPTALDANVTQKSAFFVSGSNLYLMQYTSSAGWQCVEFNSSLVGTNISTTVLPQGLRQVRAQSRVRCIVDAISNPANPIIYIYYSPISNWTTTSQNGYAIYRWNGPATQMSFIDFGGNVAHALPWGVMSQGSAWVTKQNAGESTSLFSPYAELVQRTFQTTSIRLQFKLFGQTYGQVVNVGGYYGNNSAAYATNIATFSSPSHGVLSGNTITGLTVDNGITTYEVTWNSQGDGITTNFYQFILHVTT